MTTLNECTFESVTEYLSEMSEFVAMETEGALRIVSVVTDTSLSTGVGMGIIATGSTEVLLSTLMKASSHARSKMSDDADINPIKDLLKRLMKTDE